MGTLTVDTAYGDSLLITACQLGLQIVPDAARDIVEIGRKITKAANAQLKFTHPIIQTGPFFIQPTHSDLTIIDGIKTYTNAVVIDPES